MIPRHLLPSLALLGVAALPLAFAQGGNPLLATAKGRWMNYEVASLDSFAFGSDPSRCYSFNQPGSRIFEVELDRFERGLEMPSGPGLASLALRPGTDELWAVDRVTAAVSVIRTSTGRLESSIRVGAEPHGIAFTASGDRAYVTCSAVDRVDVIDALQRRVVGQIPIPAKNPRGIARIGDQVYVLSFLSGNGTAPRGNPLTGDPDDVLSVESTAGIPGVEPLPDRDLFAFQVTPVAGEEVLDPTRTLSGIGTVLFQLRWRPGTRELWIPHMEALNGSFVGEKAFPEGQVVRNRVAIVDTSRLGLSAAPGPVRWIDLDELAPGLLERTGTPTDVAFTSDGSLAFVCGYGSDTIAVLSAGSDSVEQVGTLHVKTRENYPNGVGPRSLAVSPDDRWLLVHNKGENSLLRFAISELRAPGHSDRLANDSIPLGYDPTPGDLVQGRIHFIRTRNSASNTSSCNSCHVDGYIDGLAWELSTYLDPESTPPDQLAYPLDLKGPMVTQSVRSLREVGPYHWRGERKNLKDFNQTFIDLFERTQFGAPKDLGPDFMYIVQYMEHLAVPPNHRQQRDRSLTAEQAEGLDLFLNKPVVDGLSCADCHTLPLGTKGDLVDNMGGGHSPTGVVPPLRGLADRLSPPHQLGGDFGTRTELGVGLNHAGGQASFLEVLLRPLPPPQTGNHFDLDQQEALRIAAFLEAFDSGTAPAAAWQVTANAENVSSIVATDLAFLLSQAHAGHCDVVYMYGPEDFHGQPVYMKGLYDPSIGRFLQASVLLQRLTLQALLDIAADGKPVTFLGVPPMMGWTLGLDRDNDKLMDLDELLRGTDPEIWDTDKDKFPDGYEVHWGMNPLVHDSSSPDQVPPQLLGPVEIVWRTTNAVRLEWRTDEPVRVLVSYDGQIPVLRAPLMPRYDDRFSEIVGNLEPGRSYQFQLELEDLNKKKSFAHFEVRTLDRVLPEPARVEELSVIVLPAGGQHLLRARTRLGLGPDGPATGYLVRAAVYYASRDESLFLDLGRHQAPTGPDGVASIALAVPASLPAGSGKLYVSIEGIDAPSGAPVHIEALDVARWKAIDY